jgi:hypothetical protein
MEHPALQTTDLPGLPGRSNQLSYAPAWNILLFKQLTFPACRDALTN